MIFGVFFQNIELFYFYFTINLITLITTVRFSPTSWLLHLIELMLKRSICTISPAYKRSYFMNRESEWFELFARLLVSSIAIGFFYYYPLTTWLIGIFMGVFMMISTFFGFCLSSLGYIGFRSLQKSSSHSSELQELTTNKNCILARNGFKPYARCDYCTLTAPQCTGMQFNGFVFAIGFLAALFMFITDSLWRDFNIIAIISLLFWLTHKVTINIDHLARADFENRELNAQLKNYNESLEAEVSRRTQELEKMVKLDSITGLVNRYEFEQRLKAAIESTKNDEAAHVMCYIDLDQFKIVNDKCGHIAGDELLRQIALVLKRSARECDVVARLGGDEFGIIYIDSTMEDAQRQGQRLLNAIGEYRFNYQGNTFRIGASMGMVGIMKECCTFSNLLSQADAACYAAKDGGRNRIHVAHPEDAMIQERRNQMQWIGRLEEALINNSFVLYVQPIVPVLDSLQRRHYEVLVRLRGENGEIIPPMAFIPAAERYGFMSKLDRWVMENTFKSFTKIWHEVSEETYFSINVSGASLGDARTKDFIRGLFGNYGVPYHTITFEITETEAVGNMTNALDFINEFRALGCRFALDDFGCGLSSFSYLQNMPIDYLKIDGSFVHDIHLNPINRAMVDAINQIGHVMGIATICEYVETAAVLHVLNELNVDFAQGYHIDRPFAIETLFTPKGL
ncbi:MAG: EAL domain-containing protein [Campylobacterales bacterium]|nr:EAL domain-containing protein [Campylobacterales bacterium]